MRKIILGCLLIITVGFSKNQESFEVFKKSITSNNLYKSELLKDMDTDLYITKREKREIINKWMYEEKFQKAVYIYYTETINRNFKNKKITMPDYLKVLRMLKESTKEDNVLASAMGIKLLEKYFLMKGNTIGKEFLRDIIKPLAKENNAVGLFWYGKSFMKEWSKSGTANYPKAKKAYTLSIKKIDELLKNSEFEEDKRLKTFRIIVTKADAKAKAVLYLKLEKEKGNYHRVKRKLRKPNYTLKSLKKDK